MDQYTNAGGRQRCPIKIEMAIDLSLRGQFRINARAAQEIEGKLGLREQFVPEMQWKVFIHTAQARDKMILERANGAFSGVAAMETRWYELIIDLRFA